MGIGFLRLAEGSSTSSDVGDFDERLYASGLFESG